MADKTKLLIAEQAKEMLKKMPLNRMRITELCNAVEIERPTFYEHFKDKKDLLAWIFFTSGMDADVDLLSFSESVTHLQQMKENFFYFKNAYKLHSDDDLWLYIGKHFIKEYTRIAKEKLKTETLDPQLDISIELYCFDELRMYKEWILHDQVHPAETIISWKFVYMPSRMREVFFPESSESSNDCKDA